MGHTMYAVPGSEKAFQKEHIEGEIFTSEASEFAEYGQKVKVLDVTAKSFPRLLQAVRRAEKHGWKVHLSPAKEDMRAVLVHTLH